MHIWTVNGVSHLASFEPGILPWISIAFEFRLTRRTLFDNTFQPSTNRRVVHATIMAVLADVHITIETLNDTDEWQTCKEYQPSIEKTISTSTSWIESIDRQRFRIKWKCQRTGTPHGHWMDCRVDGTLVQGLAIDADNVEQGIEHVVEGHQSTDALMRPSSFTMVSTVAD